ncbi:HU family DNA-binding protein [Jeongeupia wiesaeckerbachi]|uniref:HU family DNA-binding protein n=1 Tax=Jeongeupia wiesaeckerbachi TaxID=3051218 RepID=UPI003D807E35
MTKKELLEAIHRIAELECPGLSKKAVEVTLKALGDVSTATLKGGGEVVLPELGKLAVKHRNARMGRNPSTGESIEIPAKSALKFTPAKVLKDALA